MKDDMPNWNRFIKSAKTGQYEAERRDRAGVVTKGGNKSGDRQGAGEMASNKNVYKL